MVFSRSSSIKYDCNPKKLVTSLEKVSSVYLKPVIILKLSRALNVAWPYKDFDSLVGYASETKPNSAP